MIKRKSALNALWVNVFLFFNSLSADPGLGPLTFGNASGEPGQVVGIEVHLRSVYPIGAYTIAFHFDASRLYPTGFDLDGAPASEVNPFGVGFKVFFPEHGLALEFLSDSSGTTPIPASESIYLGKLLFRVRAEAEEGVAIVEPVAAIANGVGNSTNVVIDLSPDETAVVPVPLVPGEIMVLPPSGPRP